jgi:hypothetical protein
VVEMESRSAVQVMGLIVILAGLGVMAYNVNIPYFGTVHPYTLVGAIILLIGFLTIFIGFAIPENPLLEDTEKEIESPRIDIPIEKRVIECKYLMDNHSCRAIVEDDEGKAIRDKSCENEPKDSCCYICASQSSCGISCDYLGKPENAIQTREYTSEDIDQEIRKYKKRMENLANLFADGKIGEESYVISLRLLKRR